MIEEIQIASDNEVPKNEDSIVVSEVQPAKWQFHSGIQNSKASVAFGHSNVGSREEILAQAKVLADSAGLTKIYVVDPK